MIKYKFKLEDDESDVMDNLLYRELKRAKQLVCDLSNKKSTDPTVLRQAKEEVKYLRRLRSKVLSSRKVCKSCT